MELIANMPLQTESRCIVKYKLAEKIKIGDSVMIKNDDSTFIVTGIRKYDTLIVFESDGGEFDHKDIDSVIISL